MAGATSRPFEREQRPVSLQVFFPFDTVVTTDDNKVREPFLTDVFFTTNPGRAVTTTEDALAWPELVWVVTENVYCVPFFSPVNLHEASSVVHIAPPGDATTTYVSALLDVEVTLGHETVTVLLPTSDNASTGVSGMPSGTTWVTADAAPIPIALVAVTVTEYVSPARRPDISHVKATVVQF